VERLFDRLLQSEQLQQTLTTVLQRSVRAATARCRRRRG
jgi:hypothetical protein